MKTLSQLTFLYYLYLLILAAPLIGCASPSVAASPAKLDWSVSIIGDSRLDYRSVSEPEYDKYRSRFTFTCDDGSVIDAPSERCVIRRRASAKAERQSSYRYNPGDFSSGEVTWEGKDGRDRRGNLHYQDGEIAPRGENESLYLWNLRTYEKHDDDVIIPAGD